MRRRFSKLNWSYGIGELAIVVTGVLIALAVDQWNAGRLDRIQEVAIVERLISDLNDDLQSFDLEASLVEAKEAALLRVRSGVSGGEIRPEDAEKFLRDVMTGANFGWNQISARETTYSELLSSGRFSLIRSAELRVRIAEYYSNFESRIERIDERETPYPHLSYRFVPREYEKVGTSEEQSRLEAGLSPSDVQQLVANVLASDIGDYIGGELNLARFILSMGRQQRAQCLELLAELETYLGDL